MHSDNHAVLALFQSNPLKFSLSEFQPNLKIAMFEQRACYTEYIRILQTQIKELQDEVDRHSKGKPDRAEIVESVKKALSQIRAVNSAYYVPVETKDLHLIVICDSGREVDALDAVIENMSTVEDEFPDVYFRPVVLSTDQVDSDTLTGARRAF